LFTYATKSQLRAENANLSVNESVQVRKAETASVAAGSTFLSHSSQDRDITLGAIRILKRHGASVYVDEIDPTMPNTTSFETAEKLKQRIKSCRKFVLLATINSNSSKWVPWELGIGDGYKSMSNIAIFPATDSVDQKAWASWEYLGLYHKIAYGDLKGYSNKVWLVRDERTSTAVELSNWLSR
jgi:TIR domain